MDGRRDAVAPQRSANATFTQTSASGEAIGVDGFGCQSLLSHNGNIAGCNGGALLLNYSPPVENLMTEENGQAGEPGEEIVGDHPLEGEKTHIGNISEAGNVRHVRQSSHVQNCPTVVSVREASAADETEEEQDGGEILLIFMRVEMREP